MDRRLFLQRLGIAVVVGAGTTLMVQQSASAASPLSSERLDEGELDAVLAKMSDDNVFQLAEGEIEILECAVRSGRLGLIHD